MNPFGLVHMHPDLLRQGLRNGPPAASAGGTRGERRWATAACLAVLAVATALFLIVR